MVVCGWSGGEKTANVSGRARSNSSLFKTSGIWLSCSADGTSSAEVAATPFAPEAPWSDGKRFAARKR